MLHLSFISKRKKTPATLIVVLLSTTITAQNVGIGVTNPIRAKLELNGAVGNTSAIFGGDGAGISLQRNDPVIGFNQYVNSAGTGKFIGNGYAAAQRLDPATGNMYIQIYQQGVANANLSSPYPVMTFSPLGRVNVGSLLPANVMLNVSRGYGSATNPPAATAAFEGSQFHSFFNYGDEEHTYIRPGKYFGNVFINDIGGTGSIIMGTKVGINTNTPSTLLEIRQNSSTAGLALVNGSNFNYWRWRVDPLGTMTLEANQYAVGTYNNYNGQYNAVSDSRLKDHVRPMSPILDKVMQLTPVKYEMIYNNPDHKEDIGFIAQDVYKLLPELVSIQPDSSGNRVIADLHMLNYSGFGTIAIKAIQEQQELIKSQEASIKAMQSQIDELRKVLSEFELHKK